MSSIRNSNPLFYRNLPGNLDAVVDETKIFGAIFYVDSNHANKNDSTGSGFHKDKPFATLAYSIVQCTANKGDIIFVAPGHVETVATAAAVDISVAGVAIFGIGTGSLRPKVNITATGAYLKFSAANGRIRNLLVTGGIDAITKTIFVDAADCVIDSCEVRDVTGQVTDGILTTANADRLKILNHRHIGDSSAGTNAAIAIVGGTGIEITIDRMDGNFAVGGIDIRTTATIDLRVDNVRYFRTRNSVDIFIIDTITGSTGQIGPNLYLRLQDNAANITEACTGATFVYHQPISIVNNAGEVGLNTNITASTDA